MRRTLVLLAAALAPLTASAATPTDPSADPVVAFPCGEVPEGNLCLQAAFTMPAYDAVLPAGETYTFRGIAERGTEVQLFYVYADGRLVNEIPIPARATEDGSFDFTVDTAQFPTGSYRLAGYYISSLFDGQRDDTFFQVTGSPLATFSVGAPSPAQPPPPPPAGEECGFDTFVQSPFGRIGRLTGSDEGNAFFLLHERSGGAASSSVRTWLHDEIFKELKKAVCRQAQENQVAPSFIPGIREALFQGLQDVGLTDLRVFNSQNAPKRPGDFYSVDEIIDEVDALLGDGCDYAASAVRNEGLLPHSQGLNDVVSMFKNACVREECSATAMLGIGASCPYEIIYQSGDSPLVFLTSDAPVTARVELAPVGGRVSYADPARTDGGWTVHVGPDVTAQPLYYEFTATAPPSPPAEGWSLPTAEAEGFLRALLLGHGYDTSEIEAFLRRDLRPGLPDAPFVELRLYPQEVTDALLPLTVTPVPSRTERLLFVVTPADAARTLTAPAVPRHVPSPGLTVREFGAVVRSAQ